MSCKHNVHVGMSISKAILPHNKVAVDIRMDHFNKRDVILTCRLDPSTFGRVIAGEHHVECAVDIYTSNITNNTDKELESLCETIDFISFPKPEDQKMTSLQYRRYCQRRSAYIYIGEKGLSEHGWFLQEVNDFIVNNKKSKLLFTVTLCRYIDHKED